MSTQEHARDVAQAFFELFLNSEKRTPQDSSAFSVYAADSIARITRAKEDGESEDVTLNGIDSISMYNLALPPSALVLNHFDALPTHNGGIVVMASGVETIDVSQFNWSRALVLAPTPQGGFYLKSDMLHYEVGSTLPSTTEVIEVLEPVKTKKVRVQNREKKPRQPRTPLSTAAADAVVEEAPVIEEIIVVAPVVEEIVAPVEEVAVVEVVEIVEPVVVVEDAPVEEVAVVAAPAVVTVPTETPQTSNKSWSQLVSGEEKKRAPKREPKVEKIVEEKEAVVEVEKVADKKDTAPKVYSAANPRYSPHLQVYVKNIPENINKSTLSLAMFQLGDVEDVYLNKGAATVTFKTAAEAQAAIKLGSLQVANVTVALAPKNTKAEANGGFRSQRK